MDSSKSFKHQVWIVNPWVDCVFLLNPVFLYLIFALALSYGYLKPTLFVSIATMLLAYGHVISPIFIIAKNPLIKKKLLAESPNYIVYSLILFALPILAYGFSVYLFFLKKDMNAIHLPIIIVAAFYALWSLWHTMSQQFGILRIYKSKYGMNSKHDRKLDLIFCFLSLYLVVGYKGWSDHANLQMSIYNAVSLKSSATLNSLFWLFPIAMLIYVLLYMFYKRVGSLAVFFCYMGIIALASSVIFYPPNNSQLLYSPVHWIQAVFLASISGSATEQSKSKGQINKMSLLKNFIFLISLGYLFILIREDGFFSSHRIWPNGHVKGLESLTATQFLYVALFFSLFIGLDFVHFYLDRLIYKNKQRMF